MYIAAKLFLYFPIFSNAITNFSDSHCKDTSCACFIRGQLFVLASSWPNLTSSSLLTPLHIPHWHHHFLSHGPALHSFRPHKTTPRYYRIKPHLSPHSVCAHISAFIHVLKGRERWMLYTLYPDSDTSNIDLGQRTPICHLQVAQLGWHKEAFIRNGSFFFGVFFFTWESSSTLWTSVYEGKNVINMSSFLVSTTLCFPTPKHGVLWEFYQNEVTATHYPNHPASHIIKTQPNCTHLLFHWTGCHVRFNVHWAPGPCAPDHISWGMGLVCHTNVPFT